MTPPSKLADRLVERLLGLKRTFTQQELETQTSPSPPRSVHAQLEEGQKQRAESRRLMRKLRRF